MLRFFVCLITILSLALPSSIPAEEVPVTRDQITLSFAPVVKRVVPAVVNIFTRHVEKVQASPFMNDPFFGQFFGNQGFGDMPRERVVNSLGSGVIVGADGTIVTSYHVVKNSDKITVALSDKREFEGHVERTDQRSDLAIIKVDTKGAKLPTLELRDSATLEVGDLVLAVGNPFGVGQTVTSGIVSALARSNVGVSDYEFFIQTDAAINPGNSGGALVDMQGRLIGINTAIYSRSGGYQGIGFAIPSEMVRALLAGKTGKGGDVIRPWLGVAVEPVTHEIADAQGLPSLRGVLVQEVYPQSPADKVGVKAGDIIVAIGPSEIDDAQSMNFRIATTGIDHPTEITLWRAGHEVKLPITFTTPPADAATGKVYVIKGNNPLSGATVANTTPDMAQELDLKSGAKGVVVVKAGEDQGFGMNVQEGDIILAVGGKEIQTVAELQKALAASSHRYEITLLRSGMVVTMTVER